MRRVGVILCGGKSSRMGRPKAWLSWHGKPMVVHVATVLGSVVDEVIVVTSQELGLPALDARVVEDREPALGPLAGIRDGLEAAHADLAFVTGTDSPFLTSGYVAEMLERGVAAAPVADGHVQVLSAVYPGFAWKDADALLTAGTFRPIALLERVGFEAVEPQRGMGRSLAAKSEGSGRCERAGPAPWQGLNTPSDYLDWARRMHPGASARLELLGRSALAVDSREFECPIGTLGEVIAAAQIPEELGLVREGRLAKSYLAAIAGRELVRDLSVPIGPGECVSIIDALAGG